jgi:DNA mismatch endonuclease (patch repair protein)
MSRIKSRNTGPEIAVRKLLFSMGYRFRLNGKVSKKHHPKGVLPGKPDIVLAKYRIVIFVHGCFWHRHEGCKDAVLPKSNDDFWFEKLNKNVIRDRLVVSELIAMGWKVKIIWECELITDLNIIIERIFNEPD